MPEFRYCFVPLCTSSSKKNPEKIFISVPQNLKRRKTWFTAARRDFNNTSLKTTFSCCQDHFNLEEDMENWIEYRLSKVRSRMKKDVVPHKFACQGANRTAIPSSRHASIARARKRNINEILENSDKKDNTDFSTSTRNEPFEFITVEQTIFKQETKIEVTESMIQGLEESSTKDAACQTQQVHYRSIGIQYSDNEEEELKTSIAIKSEP